MTEDPISVTMVSDFPAGGATHSAGRGLASYTRNLVRALEGQAGRVAVTVFATDVQTDAAPESPQAGAGGTGDPACGSAPHRTTQVVRYGRRGLGFLVRAFRRILRDRRRIDVVHVQHEYAQYGRKLPLLLPIFLVLLRLIGKPVVVTMHGVVTGPELTESFCRQHFFSARWRRLVGWAFDLTNLLIARLARHLVFHQEALARTFQARYGGAAARARIIPHGIEARLDSMPSEAAKAQLGLTGKRTILCFGYLSGYKGLDVLVRAAALLDRRQYAILVAGKAPADLAGSAEYARRMEALRSLAEQTAPHLRFTGFIPEDRFAAHFSAADVVVSPYPEMHACSGPFSLTIAYERPFLVSQAFGRLYRTPPELRFDCDPESLAAAIRRFFEDPSQAQAGVRWERDHKIGRLWPDVAEKTEALYGSTSPPR